MLIGFTFNILNKWRSMFLLLGESRVNHSLSPKKGYSLWGDSDSALWQYHQLELYIYSIYIYIINMYIYIYTSSTPTWNISTGIVTVTTVEQRLRLQGIQGISNQARRFLHRLEIWSQYSQCTFVKLPWETPVGKLEGSPVNPTPPETPTGPPQ